MFVEGLITLIARKRPLRFLEAHNGLSALVVEGTRIQQGDKILEYDGIWLSGFADSAAKGIPDAELTGPEARCAVLSEMVNVSKKPILVDGDTGGSLAQFQFLVKRLQQSGAAGVVVEDKVFPKLNSLDPDAVQRLEDPKIFSQKIRVGKDAVGSNFMIIARLESLNVGTGMEDAIERARSYIEAGCDGILIHSRSGRSDEVLTFASEYVDLCNENGRRPALVAVPTTYNMVTDQELGEAGFDIIIHANQMLRSSYKAMKETATMILLNDRGFEAEPFCASVPDVFRVVGFYKLRDWQSSKLLNLTAIIPAAGRDPIFKETPKALIPIAGKTVLDRQLEILRSIGIKKTTLTRGYKGDQFRRDDITILDNPDFDTKHSAHSLFVAREYMRGGFLLVYSDILFNREIVEGIINSDADIVLAVDNSYRFHRADIAKPLDLVISREKGPAHYRTLNPTRMIEVRQIGRKIAKELADHEFIGMAYFSQSVAEMLTKIYDDCELSVKGRFHEAESFSRADVTDFIQEVIDRGLTVNGLEVFKGWMEIHAPEDVTLAERELAESRSARTH
jgi:phosphoenolpyruvate phosphomutase